MVNIRNSSTAKHQYVRWHVLWCVKGFSLGLLWDVMIKDACQSYGGPDMKKQPYEHEPNESDVEVLGA